MPRGINQIQAVNLAIFGLVIERGGLRLDRNAPLFLDIHRIQNLGFHLTVGETATAVNQAVSQGRFAVVNMGNDGEVTYVLQGNSVFRPAAGKKANRASLASGASKPAILPESGDPGCPLWRAGDGQPVSDSAGSAQTSARSTGAPTGSPVPGHPTDSSAD